MSLRIEDLPEIESRVKLKKSAIYDLIAKGQFPRPIPLIPGSRTRVGWLSSEVDAYLEARIAERDGGDATPAAETAAGAPA